MKRIDRFIDEEGRAVRKELVRQRLEHRKKLRTEDSRMEAVKAYVLFGGNATLTAGAIGANVRTIRNWKQTEWWKKLLAEYRNAEKLELSAKAKIILDKSMDLLNHRLEQGDVIYDSKKGELVNKPLAAKELHRITVDLLDRKDKMDQQFETKEQMSAETQESKLTELANQFANLAITAIQKKKPDITVTDVVFIEEKKSNATHEGS